jgi:glycosyltransferase involved in cell wall biosynthesis
VKKLKIALLASSLLPRVGGAEVVVHNLAEGLRRENHQVDVITWWGQCRIIRHLVAYPVRPFLPRSFAWPGVGTWKRRGVARLTLGLQVAIYQARFRYDLWHIHLAFPGAALAAGTLARMGVPFLVTCHGADVQTVPGIRYGLRLNPHVDKAICAALRQATGVAAISRSIREKLLEMGVDPSRIFDVNRSVDGRRYAPSALRDGVSG